MTERILSQVQAAQMDFLRSVDSRVAESES